MPFFYMMLSVLCWSLFPLLGVWGVEKVGVFDFILWSYAVGCLASFVTLKILTAKDPPAAKMAGRLKADVVLGCLASFLSFACLLFSFLSFSRAGAVMVFESWPVLAVFLAPLLLQRGWSKIARRDMLFSALALTGLGFLMIPEAHHLTPLQLFLPLLGGLLMAAGSMLKSRVSQALADKKRPLAALLRVQTIFSAGVTLFALPCALLWPHHHGAPDKATLIIVVFTGLAVHTLGNVAYTQGLLRSSKTAILALWNLMPPLAVFWLWRAGEGHITPAIVLGSIFIITASLMMTVRADTSSAYAASVTAILLTGAYTYFSSGLGMSDYYQAISVPLFFYAILVAFMMDRLIKSDELEERLAIETMNHIDAHAAKIGVSAKACRDHVLGILTTNDAAEVGAHYSAVRNDKSPYLAPVRDQLDQLVLSKVRGTNFSEMFVIFIIGALTLVCSMLYRPDTLIADAFSIVVPLSVVFIFFTVIDLADNRRRFHLVTGKDGKMSLSGQVTQDLSGERLIAAVLIVVILAAFAGLLIHKHALH